MTLILLEAPIKKIVSVEDFKIHHNIRHDDDNELITSFIDAIMGHIDGADGILGRALFTQQWELRLDCFPSGSYEDRWDSFPGSVRSSAGYAFGIDLPLPPFQSLESFQYIDQNTGSLLDVDASVYQVVLGGSFQATLVPKYTQFWPVSRQEPHSVRIQFTAGYDGDALPIPPAIKKAALGIMSLWYENRETAGGFPAGQLSELPYGARALLAPLRMRSF